MLYLIAELIAFHLKTNYTQVHLLLVVALILWYRKKNKIVLDRISKRLLYFFIFHAGYSLIFGVLDLSQNFASVFVYSLFPLVAILVLSNTTKKILKPVIFYLVFAEIIVGYLVPDGERSSAGYSLGLLLLEDVWIYPAIMLSIFPVFSNNMRSTFVMIFVQIFTVFTTIKKWVKYSLLILFIPVAFNLGNIIVKNPAVLRLTSTILSKDFKVDSNEDGGRLGEVVQASFSFSESKNPLRWFFGAGSGFQYFDLKTQEFRSHLHVTPAAILFRYGILGVLLYIYYWWKILLVRVPLSYKVTLVLILVSSFFSGSLMLLHNLVFIKYAVSK